MLRRIIAIWYPDFKTEQKIIDRRLDVLTGEGIEIRFNVNVGADIDPKKILDEHECDMPCNGCRTTKRSQNRRQGNERYLFCNGLLRQQIRFIVEMRYCLTREFSKR